jgi:Holliday junction resolvase RusA-like endonuclease
LDPLRIIVPGEPVAKARARVFTVRSRSGATFHRGVTPEKTARKEEHIKLCFQTKYPDFTPLKGPLAVFVYAFVRIPASFSKKKREQALNGTLFPQTKPDVDNYLKLCLDALAGLAFEDDKQVVWACCHKRYHERPVMEIIISADAHEI